MNCLSRVACTLLLLSTGVSAAVGDTLKVLSLNLAHGRGGSLNQLLVGDAAIRANLARIAETLTAEGADIVALQEADGPSRWSGGFDHVAHLAELAGYPVGFRGSHADSWLFDYGTALLSRRPLGNPSSHRFAPSPPTAGKGFVLAELRWPGDDIVDLVSVHLDFSRASVREAQVAELQQVLSTRGHPLILAGDFNADWGAPNSPVRRLVEANGLQAWQPQAKDLGTYDGGKDRLDWILISRQLRFDDYRVLAVDLADHRPVIAVIGRNP